MERSRERLVHEHTLGVVKREQFERFMDWISHHPVPPSVDTAVTWRAGYWEVKFFMDWSADTPFGASSEWMIWMSSNFPQILREFHIVENNRQYDYQVPATL